MKIFITAAQKIELERLHDTTRDGRVRFRLKAVLLASEGWSLTRIAQILRLHETTVNQHINDYVNKNKIKPETGGSASRFSAEKTEQLICHLSQKRFHHTHEIVAYVAQRRALRFSVPGMNNWLNHHGFTYKKPAGIPHKFSEERQKQFIESYENLKERLWKVTSEHAWNNRYFENTRGFREAIFNFFDSTLPEIADSLVPRIHDHFQVLKPAS